MEASWMAGLNRRNSSVPTESPVLTQTESVQETPGDHGPRCNLNCSLHSWLHADSLHIQAAENVCISRMLAGLMACNQCNQTSLSNCQRGHRCNNWTTIYINILQYTTILPGLKRNAHANISNPCWDVVHKCLLRSQPSQHAILWIKSLSFFVCLIWCYMLLPNLLGLGFPDVACRWGWHSLGGCAARSSESNCLATVPEARSLVRRRVIIVIGRSRERSGIVKE